MDGCRCPVPRAARDQNGSVRSLRLGVALVAASAALLAGCTDPSPDLPDPTDEPSSETSEAASTDASDEPSAEETEEATAAAPEPPVFGTAPNQPGGAATACVADALGAPLTFSTVLTAADEITLDTLTLEPTAGDDVEILDAYVLPFTGGAGGLAVGDYPPADPSSAREDVGEYVLGAGETVIVGVGVTAASPTTMGFVLSFHGADDIDRTLIGQHEVTIADVCGESSSDEEPGETPTS